MVFLTSSSPSDCARGPPSGCLGHRHVTDDRIAPVRSTGCCTGRVGAPTGIRKPLVLGQSLKSHKALSRRRRPQTRLSWVDHPESSVGLGHVAATWPFCDYAGSPLLGYNRTANALRRMPSETRMTSSSRSDCPSSRSSIRLKNRRILLK
jgi:hypothetical protein